MCLRVFFFKQKTAYEMRISDWSSDVCSSDLPVEAAKDECGKPCLRFGPNRPIQRDGIASPPTAQRKGEVGLVDVPDRTSVVSGKSVSVRVELGGRRSIQKKKTNNDPTTSYTTYIL